jgi:hypothetical protein
MEVAPMKPAGLLMIAFALAVIANARVALLPWWVVPVPAVFLAVAVIAAGMFAAVIVLRWRFDRVPLTFPAAPASGEGTARPVVAS